MLGPWKEQHFSFFSAMSHFEEIIRRSDYICMGYFDYGICIGGGGERPLFNSSIRPLTVIKLDMIILWGKKFFKFNKTIHDVITIV